MRITTTKVALIAVFGALQTLLGLIPYTITIGVSGEITLGVIGGPLIGILMGPFFGGLAVLIGSLAGIFLNPAGAIFGVLTVLPPTVGALAAGFTKLRQGYVAGGVILLCLFIFYANPVGREVFAITWFHIFGMIVAFSSIFYVKKTDFSSVGALRPVLGIAVGALVGVLADHMTGNAIAVWYFSPSIPPSMWYGIMFVYPVERIVAFLLTVTIAVPVYFGIKRSGMAEHLK